MLLAFINSSIMSIIMTNIKTLECPATSFIIRQNRPALFLKMSHLPVIVQRRLDVVYMDIKVAITLHPGIPYGPEGGGQSRNTPSHPHIHSPLPFSYLTTAPQPLRTWHPGHPEYGQLAGIRPGASHPNRQAGI